MSTDLERQLARFAQALDQEAPMISFDDVVGRGTVLVEVDLPERPERDRASRVDGVPSIAGTPSRDETGGRDVVIELAPAVAARRPAWRVAVKVALGVAAVLALVVTLATIERGGDEYDPADVLPDLTTTFVSPRNGFSIKHPEGASVRPAVQVMGWGDVDGSLDVVEIGPATAFKATSHAYPGPWPCEPTCDPIDDLIDGEVSRSLPGGCGVPRGQQAEIIIDGQPGRVAECSGRIEATVVQGVRLYVFVLVHDRSDARAVFDEIVATIDLTPETGVDFPGLTETFVSPTYGFTFGWFRSITPATERWDPSNQAPEDRNPDGQLDNEGEFDAVETGYGAYLKGASAKLPDGVSVDAWVDEYITPRTAGGCGERRSRQAEITIDGQSGRVADCSGGSDQIEATVVAGGRLYLFVLYRDNRDAMALFESWIATIDLTPETAVDP